MSLLLNQVNVWKWTTRRRVLFYILIILFSGLSLVLNKEVCDWQRQTLNLSELKGERPAKPDLIHTSCRSESSNISLVVLDKDSVAGIYDHGTLIGWIHFCTASSFYFKLVWQNKMFTTNHQLTVFSLI